jgi:RimJ/RimL family protein N-acetyltransferase
MANNSPIIRNCQAIDVEAVLELWRMAGAPSSATDCPHDLLRIVLDSAAHLLIAEADDQIVGSIIGSFDGWRANLHRLAVHPGYRRRGIARALVAEAENRLGQQGARRINVLLERDCPWATGFWEAAGYPRDQRIARHVRTLAIKSPPRSDSTLQVDDRIQLTAFRRSDKAALVEHLNDKEIYDRTLRIPYPYTEAHAEEWLARAEILDAREGPKTGWAIRSEAGLLMGGIGFKDVEIGKTHGAEIGYWLAKPYWGQGIMTAVVTKACEFAFSELGLAKITAQVFALNTASTRVLEKCGFEMEGYLKKHCWKGERAIDVRAYAKLRDS